MAFIINVYLHEIFSIKMTFGTMLKISKVINLLLVESCLSLFGGFSGFLTLNEEHPRVFFSSISHHSVKLSRKARRRLTAHLNRKPYFCFLSWWFTVAIKGSFTLWKVKQCRLRHCRWFGVWVLHDEASSNPSDLLHVVKHSSILSPCFRKFHQLKCKTI